MNNKQSVNITAILQKHDPEAAEDLRRLIAIRNNLGDDLRRVQLAIGSAVRDMWAVWAQFRLDHPDVAQSLTKAATPRKSPAPAPRLSPAQILTRLAEHPAPVTARQFRKLARMNGGVADRVLSEFIRDGLISERRGLKNARLLTLTDAGKMGLVE